MALHFDPATGLTVDDTAVVRADIEAQWKAAFKKDENTPELNTEPETPAGQLIDGMTALVAEKDSEVLQLSNMFNPNTATGVFQDALGKIYFLERHVAQPTTVTCQCKGLNGTVIPQGAIIESADGQQFASLSAAMIPAGGMVEVLFAAVEKGPILVNSNTLTKIITVIPGWDSVNNAAAGIVGRNLETQTEFEERRYNSVAKNSHGLAASVEGTVANLSNVIACRIEQNRTNEEIQLMGVTIPAHSVYLSVYGGDAEEIGEVIHKKLDAGCGTAGNTSVRITDETNGSFHTYFYTNAILTDLYVKVTCAPDATYVPDTVRSSIINNLSGGLSGYSRVKMGDEIYASRFYQTVISAGLEDLLHVDLSLDGNTYTSSVRFNLNQMPTLSAENIVFVEG